MRMIACTVFLVLFFQGAIATGQNVTEEEYAMMPTLFPTDDYDKCMMYGKRALYCFLNFQLEPISKSQPSDVWKVIETVSSSPTHYRHDLIRYFLCIPDSCPDLKVTDKSDETFKRGLERCLNQKYAAKGLKGSAEIISCKTAEPVYQLEFMDYIVLVLFLVYIVMVLVVSLYDFKVSYEPPESYKRWKDSSIGSVAVAFSIPSNWTKFKSESKSIDAEKLKSVQGLRVYMTFMVVMVHTITAYAAIPSANPQFVEEANDTRPVLGELAKRGIFLLSFHFMMSTWVLMNSMLAKSDKNEAIDLGFIAKSIIKRYLRFLPTVALIVVFYATWIRHIPLGPYWHGTCQESERCRKNGWTNILFIQNYVDRYYMCYIVSWYLGMEMQYYIICLFIIWLLHKNRSLIPLIVGLLLPLNMAFGFWDHYKHGYPSKLSSNPEDTFGLKFNQESQWHDHFASYHANFSGSLLGLIFGYYYYKHKTEKLFQSQISKIIWWIMSFGAVTATMLIPQFYDVDQTTAHSALWVAATRPLFGFGMGLMIFGMSHGLGGFVKWILEWNPLQVLAKLSFCVYIGHALFQNIRVGLMRAPAYLDYYAMMNTTLSDIAVAFIAALFLTLFFEMPASDLANMLFKTKRLSEEKKTK